MIQHIRMQAFCCNPGAPKTISIIENFKHRRDLLLNNQTCEREYDFGVKIHFVAICFHE